ncbi:hypothetical protein DERP_003592 [Dermatophagoides pteronyssinus]|uniref:Uncharacterized protein n=1 Tax=Dermatophagoides pteronyssinus TaxID=6956 RepID=A0ABQ8JL68_DERPT|nr:hypothetical protein DERP_003592 [Dermatophagoides pteronyssinus]
MIECRQTIITILPIIMIDTLDDYVYERENLPKRKTISRILFTDLIQETHLKIMAARVSIGIYSYKNHKNRWNSNEIFVET